MAQITSHAGDWGKGKAELMFGQLVMPKVGSAKQETISIKRLRSVEIATEESVKRVSGAVGWGVAGAVVFGPVGAIAGALLGGRGKDITFVAMFSDDRKFLGTAKSKVYTKLQAASF